MLIEITILRYDKCILYILWNLVEGQVVGIMITFEFCQNLAIGIINKTCLGGFKGILGRGSDHLLRLCLPLEQCVAVFEIKQCHHRQNC